MSEEKEIDYTKYDFIKYKKLLYKGREMLLNFKNDSHKNFQNSKVADCRQLVLKQVK